MSNKLSKLRNFRRRIDGVTMPIRRKRVKWQRNWLCLCGSGKKYKKCCIGDINNLTAFDGNASMEAIPENIQKMIDIHEKEKEKEKGKE
jgi:hypothetical protein